MGEITLVMIGILLALQVNNWNEERQLSKKEYKLISELKNDLLGTKNELKIDLDYLSRIIKISNSIIQYLDTVNAVKYKNSQFGDEIEFVLGNVKLYPRTIAYENLKSIGNELISNDSIRYYISEIYDRKLPRIEHWENSAIVSEKELYNSMEQYLKATPSTGKDWFGYIMVPNSLNNISKKLFINRMALMQNDRYLLNELYKELSTLVDKLLIMLEIEYFTTK